MRASSVLCLMLIIPLQAMSQLSSTPESDSLSIHCSLNITSSPDGAEVLLDGKPFGRTPVVCGELPLGTHFLQVRLAGFMDYVDTLTFDVARMFIKHVQLVVPGTLTITSDPPDAHIEIDGVVVGVTPVTKLQMKPGIIRLQVTKLHHTSFEQSVIIQEGKESLINVQLRARQGSLTLRVIPENTEVFVDGRPIGRGSIEDYQLDAGRYVLSVKDEGHEVAQPLFVPPGSRVEVRATVNQHSLAAFWRSMLLPGLGQLMGGNVPKGLGMMVAFGGSAAFLAASVSSYASKQESYALARETYRTAVNEATAREAGDKAFSAYQEMETSFKNRRTAAILTGLLYAGILIDAYLHHDRVGGFEAIPQKESASLQPIFSASTHSMALGIQLNF